MNAQQNTAALDLQEIVQPLVETQDLVAIVETITPATSDQVTSLIERLPPHQRAIVYRLLPKERALEVFERLSPGLQSDLIHGLRDAEVASIFADLDPDDRVWLLDELPASLAPRLLQGLSPKDRQLTAEVLGYPKHSVGRRMSPEYVSVRAHHTVEQALQRVRARLDDAETVYTLPVLDGSRRVVGVVSLRSLLRAEAAARSGIDAGPADEPADEPAAAPAPSGASGTVAATTEVSELMQRAEVSTAYEGAEQAARKCAELGLLALPIVDHETRLVGLLTVDDAVRILEHEETEDSARQGGVEPLRRPYFSTPLRTLVSSRVVWLLVLAVGATLTVQVLSVFEATLEQVTVLALFVPLLIGTGGNTGNQAATTVTRALALGDVSPRDVWRVMGRESCVGASLGALLGLAGGAITALVYEPRVGLIIALTLLAVCAMAATIGGVMPIVARAVRVDPAVFSNPFITTFVDATGLIIYFLVARAVLGL